MGIKDNYDESVKIYELHNNYYLLSEEMNGAMLFNILGQKAFECKDLILDLTSLPIGVYFLHYYCKESNLMKSVKLLKRY